MFSRRSGHRFNRGRVSQGGGTPNPVQPGVASVSSATPQEGASWYIELDLSGVTDGFTTSDAVAVLGGVDQGSATDLGGDIWRFSVDPVTFANTDGVWLMRRETAEGNRNSNTIEVTVLRVHAVIFPLPFALGAS